MIIGFIVVTMVSLIFLGIGRSSLKSEKAVGFFTFVNPPVVKDIEKYNREVAYLWYGAAILFELLGIPFLFAEQNSPWFIVTIFAVMIITISMIVRYLKIEAKYRGVAP